MRTTLIFLLLIGIGQYSGAQAFEGRVVMDLLVDSTQTTSEMAAFIPHSAIKYVKGNKTRIETTGGMMNQVIIVDEDSAKITVLMNMMGQKIAMVNPLVEATESEDVASKLKIEYTGAQKQIAGYTCSQAILTLPGDEKHGDLTTEVWYCQEFANHGREFRNIKGMPFEYTQDLGGMQVVYHVSTVIREKLEDQLFTVPADYKVMTSEEMGKLFPMLPAEE